MDVESKGLKSDLVKGHRTSKRMDQRRKGTNKNTQGGGALPLEDQKPIDFVSGPKSDRPDDEKPIRSKKIEKSVSKGPKIEIHRNSSKSIAIHRNSSPWFSQKTL